MKKLEEIAQALQGWIAEKKPKKEFGAEDEPDLDDQGKPMEKKVEDSFNKSLNMSKNKK